MGNLPDPRGKCRDGVCVQQTGAPGSIADKDWLIRRRGRCSLECAALLADAKKRMALRKPRKHLSSYSVWGIADDERTSAVKAMRMSTFDDDITAEGAFVRGWQK